MSVIKYQIPLNQLTKYHLFLIFHITCTLDNAHKTTSYANVIFNQLNHTFKKV